MSEPKQVRERTEFRDSLMKWVLENLPEWEQDPTCADWLGRVSEGTQKSIRYSFPVFLGFVKKAPSKIYKERIEDLRSEDPRQRGRWESEVVKFKNALMEHHYTENSVKAMVGRIQSFFKHNLIPLSFPRGWLKVRETEFAKTQHQKRLRLNNSQLREMYAYAESIESRLAFLLMVQNGLGPSTISKLRIEMIPINEDTPEMDEAGFYNFVYFETDRSKTGIDVDTFLSGELIHDYQIHLDKRGWPKSGYLFETRTGEAVRGDHISEWINELSGALGEDLADQFTPYNLRHYFHQSLENARIPDYHKRGLMGHAKRGAEGSYLGGIEGLLESYRNVFPRLSVNSVQQTQSDMKAIKAEMGRLKGLQLKIIEALFASDNPKEALAESIDDVMNWPKGTTIDKIRKDWSGFIQDLRERLE